MAASGLFGRCRHPLGRNLMSIRKKETTDESTATTAVGGWIPGRRRESFILPCVVMLYSILIFILSIYGLATFRQLRNKRSGSEGNINEVTFPFNILVCSLILGVFGTLVVVYQTIGCWAPRLNNYCLVFASYLTLLLFALGTIIVFAHQAAQIHSLEGLGSFYAQIGLLAALIVTVVIYLICPGNPMAQYKHFGKVSSDNSDEESARVIGGSGGGSRTPIPELPRLQAVEYDRVDSAPQIPLGGLDEPKVEALAKVSPPTVADGVHYNPVDPYHPLRLNPPEYSEVMEPSLKKDTARVPESPPQTTVQSSVSLTPSIPTVRESLLLRWMSWSRLGNSAPDVRKD